MKRSRAGFVTVLAMLLALAGCAGETGPTPLVFEGQLPADPGPDVGGLALQEDIFADGMITFAEYERAVTAGIQCMRDEGFDVEGPLRYPAGYLLIAPGFDPRDRLTLRGINTEQADGLDRFGLANERCQAQWYYAVERLWDEQIEPTEDEIRAWLERAWGCAAEGGMPLSQPPTEDEAIAAVRAGCEPWLTNG